MNVVLSHFQIKPLLQARREAKESIELSPDLGISTTTAILGIEGIGFPSFPNARINWSNAEKISRDENGCFIVHETGIERIQIFSELTNRAYSLFPTRSAPTMLVAGFPMHRIKDSDPYRDGHAKAKALAPIRGTVLDTATGLGYTVIQEAKSAEKVITIELDPAAQYIARQNPWSRDLFELPNIEQRLGDSFEIVPTFPEGSFDRIQHDPPTMALAGDLYSQELYAELYRVLKRGGKLFHYIGDPSSKFGANTTRGVVQRLGAAGFKNVRPAPQAFGVVAVK